MKQSQVMKWQSGNRNENYSEIVYALKYKGRYMLHTETNSEGEKEKDPPSPPKENILDSNSFTSVFSALENSTRLKASTVPSSHPPNLKNQFII